MEKTEQVQKKAIKFSVEIHKVCTSIKEEFKEHDLAWQMIRSSSSIGANIFEAQGAISKKAFSNKISIAYGEVWETIYWLELLKELDLITEATLQPLKEECDELRRILYATLKTTGRIQRSKKEE